MDVIYNFEGMQFGFKFDDDKSEEELKAFLSKLRGAAIAQKYKNEIEDNRKNIFLNEQNIAAEDAGLQQFMSHYHSKQKEFDQLGGHGEYQMNGPERTQRDRHTTNIQACRDNIERSKKQIDLLKSLISG